MADECIHELPRATCGVCNGAMKRAAAIEAQGRRFKPAERGPWFFARYDGKCSDCGEQFESGQKIRSDGDGGWLCEDCGVLEP
jgi:predicted nucleic acid-binding Zn ribbon protein